MVVHGGRLRKRFDDCFVGVTVQQDPTTYFLRKFTLTRPASTFRLVKATRLTAILGIWRGNPRPFYDRVVHVMKRELHK